MRNKIVVSSLCILVLLILLPICLGAQTIVIESKIPCLDNHNDTILGFVVSDIDGVTLTNTTVNCTITFGYKGNTISDLPLKYASHFFYQNFSTAFMGTSNWWLDYHVHCANAGNGYLTSSVLVGDCGNYYNSNYFDRKIDPTIVWGWALALIVIGFFTVYFTSMHHPLSYMFLIIDLLLMNVLFWFSGQSCNLQHLSFCITMWALYRVSLVFTFFMIIIIFIEFLRWLIKAKDKKNKKTEFEQYGYTGGSNG